MSVCPSINLSVSACSFYPISSELSTCHTSRCTAHIPKHFKCNRLKVFLARTIYYYIATFRVCVCYPVRHTCSSHMFVTHVCHTFYWSNKNWINWKVVTNINLHIGHLTNWATAHSIWLSWIIPITLNLITEGQVTYPHHNTHKYQSGTHSGPHLLVDNIFSFLLLSPEQELSEQQVVASTAQVAGTGSN